MNNCTETNTAADTRLPWSARLEQAQQGSGWADDYCIGLAKALRDFPLTVYLQDDPELLEELWEMWSPEITTFGEAAALIAYASRNEDEETINRIMRRFVSPLLDA